jgi:Chlorophyll A-B binding protein
MFRQQISFMTASAFAPAARVARSSSMKMAFESAEGAQAPLGFWDPLGLLKEADQDRFDRLRFVELKHGRVSMLAVLGHLVTSAGIRFNGQLDLEGHSFADTPAGFAALGAIPALGLFQIIVSIGWWDLKGWKQVEGSTPGDFGIPYLKYLKNDAERASKRAIELNNGRAAQMGILAIMIHEKIDGHPYIINDLLGFPFAINQ